MKESLPMPKKLKLNGSMMTLQDLLELIPINKTKKVLFIIEDCNAKVGSQEIAKEIGNFTLAVQNEAEQRLTEFSQENTLVIANILFQQHMK